ncbi:Flavonoid 3'-hydroxylase [Heracleum sosnowskyi]|uniref:Flavonoid 3'-hydroxylase n=1 Tax=Heracleum sosnowskyi TaxID=360622 RepID=A0AAD8IMA2_9APIA|nr:Flavonoid 3'-hydroxylase [Heracleum sosnowskyi]
MDPQGIKRRLAYNFENLIKLFDVMVDERLELNGPENSRDSTSTAADVLDELLKLVNTNEIDKSHIQHMFVDLFGAGTDTSSSTVEWAMSEILRKPATILVKAKAELDQVIGKGKILEEGGIAPKELNMEDKFGLTLAKLHPLRVTATSVVL